MPRISQTWNRDLWSLLFNAVPTGCHAEPLKYLQVGGLRHGTIYSCMFPPCLSLGWVCRCSRGKARSIPIVFWWIYGRSFHFRNVWEDLQRLRHSLFLMLFSQYGAWKHPFTFPYIFVERRSQPPKKIRWPNPERRKVNLKWDRWRNLTYFVHVGLRNFRAH